MAKTPNSQSIAYEERASTLERARVRKMARSVHAYVRGNTLKFYEWLQHARKDSLPQGPPIWICGDCHVGNLGPIASADGKVEIEIRDLDQTVIGNPAHDLIRLALSLSMSARGSDLPGVTTANMLEHMMEGYQAALLHPNGTHPNGAKRADLSPINDVLQSAVRRRWKHLAEERIDDVKPDIPLGKRFWKLSDAERTAIEDLFAQEGPCKLITQLKGRDDKARVKVVDAAYWMKGCSSLGKLRYAVLISVGKRSERTYCLVDIKEAVEAAAPSSATSAAARKKFPVMPSDFAERVVTGACALSPYLGQRMMAASLLRKPVVLRELMPQDLKLEIDALTCDQAVGAARFLAGVLGKAHGRQMDVATRKRWSNELNRNRSKTLDAPSWLWQSMLELIAEHEVAYLEHCRRYATQPPTSSRPANPPAPPQSPRSRARSTHSHA
jgi:uncharacterized protein (DUF2252 family)